MTDDVLIYSFHTKDAYYTGKADELKAALGRLGLPYRIDAIDIPEGKEWPDICRQKIGMIKNVCDENPDKKIFWIDVDCYLFDLPDYVKNFSADIIGYQRGFSTPDLIGYAGRTRFWEPCFWGINTSKSARGFINDALEAEKAYQERATDDYFFEESWRKNGSSMSFQIIPSMTAARTEAVITDDSFFVFGASGNVAKFKGKVSQHTSLLPASAMPITTRVKQYGRAAGAALVPERLKPFIKRALSALLRRTLRENVSALTDRSFRIQVLSAAKNGDRKRLDGFEKSIAKQGASSSKRKLLQLGYAMCAYRESAEKALNDNPVKLGWWIDPAPGNFGDWLSPYIFQKISGRGVEFVSPVKGADDRYYLSIGSIGKFARPASTLMGVGVSRKDAIIDPDARVVSLRGPRTGAIVTASGGVDPGVYGDPAILLPKLFKPEGIIKTGRVGLVRHFTHLPLDLTLPEHVEEVSIFASSPDDIEGFITKLHEFDYVISSAMHGFIACQAYGIPCALVTFEGGENNVHGDGLKYADYFEGVGMHPVAPVLLPRDLRAVSIKEHIIDTTVPNEHVERLYDIFVAELKSR